MNSPSRPARAGRRLAMVWLAAASCWPHVALAQQSDGATIDATATLSKAPPILTLKPTDSLRFGTVQIHPVETGTCAYQVGPDGALTIAENGSQVKESTNCVFLDSAQGAGGLTINCDAGLVVRVAVTPESTSGDSAIQFNTNENLVFSDGSLTTTPGCKSDGTIAVALGGQLFVQGTAKPIDSETVIGRILLDVAYDDGSGCEYCQ